MVEAEALLERARAAQARAYVPYARFRVDAALFPSPFKLQVAEHG